MRHWNSLLMMALMISIISACSDYNCLKCIDSICIECDTDSFYYSKYGACVKYEGLHCLQIDNNGNCLACVNDFKLMRDGNCVYVFDRTANCAEYIETNGVLYCDKCIDKYHLIRMQCYREIENCLTYQNGRNRCLACQPGYLLSRDQMKCTAKTGISQ